MPYLVDGNNLIGVSKDFDINDREAREKLTNVLKRYQKLKNNTITVIYDGPPANGLRPELHLGDLHVIYAGPASDADTQIIAVIKSSNDPGSYIVVSSDRSVVDTCKWFGAKTMSAQSFYADVRKALQSGKGSENTSESVSGVEIEDWKEYFGFSEDDLG